MIEFLRDYSAQLVSVGIAAAVFFGGLYAFYRQREYELVRQRYLFESVDQLGSDFEHALQVNSQLFQRGMNLLRQYREMEIDSPSLLLSERPPQLDMTRMRALTAYRVQTLIDSHVFWDALQLLFARVQEFSDFFRDDLQHGLGKIVAGEFAISVEKADFLLALSTRVSSFHARTFGDFGQMLFLLQQITIELEPRRFSFRTVQKFKKLKQIRALVLDADQLLEQLKQRPSYDQPPDTA